MSEWISVKDRLPEIKKQQEYGNMFCGYEYSDSVLVIITHDETNPRPHIEIARLEYACDYDFCFDKDTEKTFYKEIKTPIWRIVDADDEFYSVDEIVPGADKGTITHWMPLPELPKAN